MCTTVDPVNIFLLGTMGVCAICAIALIIKITIDCFKGF